jgi:hypothetical protein
MYSPPTKLIPWFTTKNYTLPRLNCVVRMRVKHDNTGRLINECCIVIDWPI